MPRGKKKIEDKLESATDVLKPQVQVEPETISIPKAEWEQTQATIQKLLAVADKGRLFNYETEKAKGDKKPKTAKLSVFGGGFIVGWRTLKDEIVRHPVTGLPVGESQEYELLILDHEGKTQKSVLPSYVSFSNARYNERVEVEILKKSEDFDGTINYTVRLPDGRECSLGAQFMN